MANKRMLAQAVIESDAFYTLSVKAQALYLHINMTADDDGFTDRVLMTSRALGGSIDEIRELVENGFLIEFKNPTTYLIRHWRVNNNKIQGDRYKSTIHQNFLSMVEIDDVNVYQVKEESLQITFGNHSLTDCDKPLTSGNTKKIQNVNKNAKSVNKPLTSCEQPVNKPLTQNRIDKNRVDKTTTTPHNTVGIYTTEGQGVNNENIDKSTFIDPNPCNPEATESGKTGLGGAKNVDMMHLSKSNKAEKTHTENTTAYGDLTDEQLRQIVRMKDNNLNEAFVFLVDHGYNVDQELSARLRKVINEAIQTNDKDI